MSSPARPALQYSCVTVSKRAASPAAAPGLSTTARSPVMRPVSVADARACALSAAAPVPARPLSPVTVSQALRLGRCASMLPVSATSRAVCAWSLVWESSAPVTALALWAM